MARPYDSAFYNLRPYLGAGLAIAVAVNLLFIAVHLWSSGGQTTVVEITNRGAEYTIAVDGTPVENLDPIRLDAPASGGISLTPPTPLASFPEPSGIDSVVVIDANGNELFRDDFDVFNVFDVWQLDSGSFRVVDGVLVPQQTQFNNTITLLRPAWTDYTVRVTYRNSRGGNLGSHVTEDGGVYYHFETIRDFPNFVDVFKDGQRTALEYGGFVHTDGVESLRSIGAMITGFYPYAVLALLAGIVLTALLARFEPEARGWLRLLVPRVPREKALPALLALAIALGAFALTLAINERYYGFLPHVPDEVSYMYQGRLLAHLQVTAHVPPVKDAFYFYGPPFLYEHGDRWASWYPFGHPLVLAIGAVFGLMWLVPSVVGAATVYLTYAVGRRLYDARTGLAAAALFAASPFFLMQSSSFMSHNTGVLYILLSLYFILRRDRPVLYGLIGGLAFGLGGNTRLLNMAALVLPFGALLLSYAVPLADRRNAIAHIAAFIAGGLLMGVALLAYNYGVTGDPLTLTYAGTANDTSQLFGFREGHTLDIGIRNQQAQVTALLLVFNAWPAFAGLAFVCLPFLLGTRNRWDYFCLACAAIPMAVYVFYRFSGVYEGPRYWYEAMPFLVLLGARGIELAGRLLNAGAFRLRSGRVNPVFTGPVLVYGVVAVLVLWGSGGWLFGWRDAQDSPNLPTRASEIDGVFGIDDRLDLLADRTPLHNALVLVKPCGFFESVHCYGTVFLRNDLDFNGNVVWARYIAGRNQEIVDAFPGREVYVASWDPEASIEPYNPVTDR